MDIFTLTALFFLVLSFIGLSWFAGSDAPYVPTKMHKLKEILKESGVGKGKVFYELGSGDGRVVITAAELGAQASGVEQSWIRVWYSRFIAKQRKLNNCHFYHGDLFTRHYYPADIVYIYMLQKAVDRLEEKLTKELKKGATVITQKYHFQKRKPVKKIGNFWIYQI